MKQPANPPKRSPHTPEAHPAPQDLPAPADSSLTADLRLHILQEIQRAILDTQDLKAVAQDVLAYSHLLAPGVVASSVLLLDRTRPTLAVWQARLLALRVGDSFVAWPDDEPLNLSDLALDLHGLAQGQVCLLSDPQAHPASPVCLPFPHSVRPPALQSCLCVPLRAGGDLIGVLSLASQLPAAFHDLHIQAARAVGDALALAIQQARLLEAEQQRRREAENLRDLMAALASSVNLNQVLEVILRSLGKTLRYDRAALYMVNESQPLSFRSHASPPGESFPNIYAADDPILETLRTTGQPLIVADIQQDPRFASWPEQELVRGWMGVPLFAGPEMIGVVSLGNLDPHAYTPADAEIAQMFTRQAADVLVRARQQEDSSRQSEELKLLTTFSFALRQVEDRQEVLAALMQQVSQVFGAARGTFFLLENDASALLVTFSQAPDLLGQWHPHGPDPLWQALQDGEARFFPDKQDFRDKQGFCDLDDFAPFSHLPIYQALLQDVQALALLPLGGTDHPFGLLCFAFQEPHPFTPEEKRLFQVLSEIAGSALRRAAALEGLEKQVNQRTRHLSTLYELSALASEPVELGEMLDKALDLALQALKSAAGAVHLFDEPRAAFVLAAARRLPRQLESDFQRLPASQAFWRSLTRSSEPVILPEVRTDPRTPLELLASPFRAYLVAPLRAKGQTLGLLSLFSEGVLDYTVEEITLFTTIAEQLGAAVERARLFKQAQRTAVAEERQRLARELHDSISQILYSLVLYAGAGRKVLRQGDLQASAEYLERIDQASLQALKEMRLMVYELRPAIFREEGLVGALRRRLQAVEERTGMRTRLTVHGELSLDEDSELALYRICEEALNNTLKHAGATQVDLALTATPALVMLEIRDNGKGFDPQQASAQGGLGLLGMAERVRQLGGELLIQSSPGQGTLVRVQVEVKT